MEDGKIIELFLKRDEQAITETAVKYGSRLKALSKKIVFDDGLAEECVNDTYLKTWNTIPPHEPREYFFAFLAKIARALSMDGVRKMNAAKRSAMVVALSTELEECIGGDDQMSTWVDDRHFTESLNRYLKSVSREKRDAFVRRYFYMDEVSEIADRHSCKESRITTMLYRMRKELKEYLEKEGIHVGEV